MYICHKLVPIYVTHVSDDSEGDVLELYKAPDSEHVNSFSSKLRDPTAKPYLRATPPSIFH